MDTKEGTRIRYADEEEADGRGRVRTHQRPRRQSRASSVGSLSIRSTGGSRVVEPGNALPITYRTLSIEVDEGLQSKQDAVNRVKEKTAVGKYFFLSATFTALHPKLAVTDSL